MKENNRHSLEKQFQNQDWQKARRTILKALSTDKDNHWLLSRLATTYYEQHEYKEALKFDQRALSLEPRCPLALWGCASALDMLGRETQAIRIWKHLLSQGEKDVGYGRCGEGLRWARSLLNDSRYRIGLAYRDLGKRTLAIRYLTAHIANRSRRLQSIYRMAEVKRELAELEQVGQKKASE